MDDEVEMHVLNLFYEPIMSLISHQQDVVLLWQRYEIHHILHAYLNHQVLSEIA